METTVKTNSLAIDAKLSEQEEAELYSEMIRAIWGNKTFSIHDLKSALNDCRLGNFNRQILLKEFKISPKLQVKYTDYALNEAINSLHRLNQEVYHFLTVTKIEHLLAEAEKLTQVNDRVLQDSYFFNEWEKKLNSLPIPPRAINALERQQIYTINDLSAFGATFEKLSKISSIRSLAKALRAYGLEIK